MRQGHRDVYILLVSLAHLQTESIQPPPIAAIHTLPQAAVIRVAIVVGVIREVGVACGFLVRAVHSIAPFSI